MSSQLSNTSTVVDWIQNDSPLSSQFFDELLTESQNDPSRADPLQDALSGGWASYMQSQHTSREIATLKQNLDDQVRKISGTLALQQRDLSDHQKLTTTNASETKERLEQLSSELALLAVLRDALPRLQQDVRSNQEQLSSSMTDINDRLGNLQEKVESMGIITPTEISSIRQQYGTSLEAVETLQGELRELRAEKATLKQKLAALETQVGTVEARPGLPRGAVELIGRLLDRQDELGRLLEQLDSGSRTGEHSGSQTAVNTTTSRALKRRRSSDKSRRSSTERAPPSGRDVKSLLLHYRAEYKRKRPKSDVKFIWNFIESIDGHDLKTHIQLCLAADRSQHVTMKPGRGRRPGSRLVDIQRGLTWKKFQRALLAMPGLPVPVSSVES
ncbi:hypothetical protein B0T16DRAFT_315732 [Cercophora newfieldiana]|uniref:Uncharacterized protein n=1 Tax=Cercophora newfieldiana TaxID=92897 RepID=A0AA39YPN8_9PEZI|nr:hypothetical protein B0T16DRAFT_315732 [Cercophora newfieldiana]